MKREFGSKLIEQVLPRLDLTHVVDVGRVHPGARHADRYPVRAPPFASGRKSSVSDGHRVSPAHQKSRPRGGVERHPGSDRSGR